MFVHIVHLIVCSIKYVVQLLLYIFMKYRNTIFCIYILYLQDLRDLLLYLFNIIILYIIIFIIYFRKKMFPLMKEI